MQLRSDKDNVTMVHSDGNNTFVVNETILGMATLVDLKMKLIFSFLYVSVILVAVIGNSVVCYTVLCFLKRHTVTSYFILNLAISDILMATMCIPFTFLSNLIFMYWPFGAILCPMVSYLQVVSVFVSAYTMIAVSIDRYISIVYPFYRGLTKRNALLMIIVIWALSLIVPLPTAVTSQLVPSNVTGKQHCYEVWDNNFLKYCYSLVITTLQYFLPVAFLSMAYGKVTEVLWCGKISAKRCRGDNSYIQKKKMVNIMITIVVMYTVCWLPLHVITLIGDKNPSVYDNPHMPILWIAFHWLAMSNCAYNPFVYYWMGDQFKASFRHVFRCCHRRDISVLKSTSPQEG